MKLKDVGFFQRHLEKVLLGAVAVFALTVIGIYLVGDPFTVEINNRRVAPGEVSAVVAQRAAELQRRLNDEQSLGDREAVPEPPDLTTGFRSVLVRQPDRFAQLWPIGAGPMPLAAFEPPEGIDTPYYVPRPQMPENVIARPSYGALGRQPQEMGSAVYRRIVDLVGHEEPRDFRYASVGGEFNVDEWRRKLEQKPEDAEGAQLRRLWWARMVGVAGVFVERQRLDPLTGEWSETTLIEPLPHQIAFHPADRVQWSSRDAEAALSFIRENQPRIQQAPFVPLKGDRQWRPPHRMPAPLGAIELNRLQTLNRNIERATTQIARFESLLQRRNLPRDQESEIRERLERQYYDRQRALRERNELLGLEVEQERGMEPRPGRFERPDMPQRPAGSQRGSGGPFDSPTPEAVRASIPHRGDYPRDGRSHDQPRYLYDQGSDGRRDYDYRDQRGGMPSDIWNRDQRRGGVAEDEEPRDHIVRIWAHDLTVEPGQTYRYRLIVTVLNPLFRQDRVPDEQREYYYDKLALGPDEQTLAETSWTDPVRIDPEYYFFLVGGSAENELAEIEFWQIYDGAWRRGEFQVRPGDPIAGQVEIETAEGTIALDMGAEAVLVDLVSRGGGGMRSASDAMRMLYYDKRHNAMADRMVDEDRESIDRMRLESEITLQRALARQAQAGR